MRNRFHIAARLAATLLVVLWAAQPVLAIAHAQEHAHRYCPAHRAFEEAAGNTGTTVAALDRDARSLQTQPPSVPGGSLRHEECAFVSVSTRDEVASAEAPPVMRSCLAVSRPATAPPPPLPSLSVLDTAPKASPPARPSCAEA